MTFGKYKGQSIEAVSDQALQHYLKWDQLRPEQRTAILAEVRRRKTAADSPPARPARPPDRVRLCAFDLVLAGQSALSSRYPSRIGVIEEAGTLLRTLLEQPPPERQPELPVQPAEDEVPF